MRRLALVLVGAALAVNAAGALAQTEVSDTTRIKESYEAHCASCHGIRAEREIPGLGRTLRGQTSDDIMTKLDGYKDGTYGGARKKIMEAKAAALTSEQREDLANYIGGL